MFKTRLDLFLEVIDRSLYCDGKTQISTFITSCTAASATAFGGKKSQQDRATGDNISLIEEGDGQFFAVYDGHKNEECAEQASLHLPEHLAKRAKSYAADLCDEDALWNACKVACSDTAMQCRNEKVGFVGGTTACGVIVRKNKLHFINVGDSRGLVVDQYGNATQMTEDAKPDNKRYKKTISKLFGEALESKKSGEWQWRVGNEVSSARGLGDGYLAGISSRPKLTECSVEPEQTVVLVSDGLSDLASTEQIGQVAHVMRSKGYTPGQIADVLVRLALQTIERLARDWMCPVEEVGDNITATVIFSDEKSTLQS